MLELAYVNDVSMCGLALDIKRCFNALPRLPVFHALARMNFPSWLLKAWAQFVCRQERRFKIRMSIGKGHASNVGFPEGCAFSVFAMCIVNWMSDLWLYHAMPSVDLYTYVDDWQVTFGQSGQVLAVWNHVCGFATSMDLELDSDKSYLWAATMADRAVLKSHSHVAVALSAKDLGAHHNFCKRSWKSPYDCSYPSTAATLDKAGLKPQPIQTESSDVVSSCNGQERSLEFPSQHSDRNTMQLYVQVPSKV